MRSLLGKEANGGRAFRDRVQSMHRPVLPQERGKSTGLGAVVGPLVGSTV